MSKPEQNHLKALFMKELLSYIREDWGKGDKVNQIKIKEDMTFTDNLVPTFYEKFEGNVTLERAEIPHTYGVLWTAEDVKIQLSEVFHDEGEEITVFSRTYVNDTEESIHVSEKMEQEISISNTTEIGFTEKINAGYQQEVSIGVDIGALETSTSIQFNAGIELGKSQTTTKNIQEVTTTGFAFEFELPARSVRTVSIVATKKTGRIRKQAFFIPRGKAYAAVSYGDDTLDNLEKAHIYVLDLDAMSDTRKQRFRFPVDYVFGATVHNNFHVQITSGNKLISKYLLQV